MIAIMTFFLNAETILKNSKTLYENHLKIKTIEIFCTEGVKKHSIVTLSIYKVEKIESGYDLISLE